VSHDVVYRIAGGSYPESAGYVRVMWGYNAGAPPGLSDVSLFQSPEFDKFALNHALYQIRGCKMVWHPVEVMGAANATYSTDELMVSSSTRVATNNYMAEVQMRVSDDFH